MPSATKHKKSTRTRKRNVTWFNPPYSLSVATNIGGKFLNIISREFPKNHVLHKLFNRNHVKVSYSCMGNIKSKINSHNKRTLKQQEITISPTKKCNCRVKNNCPLDGNCLIKSVIYQALVTTENNQPVQSYVGLTEGVFKTRFTNHMASFRSNYKKNDTELSKHIWNLRESNTPYTISWNVVKQAHAFNTSTRKCDLCLWEKFYIISRPHLATLNSRNELVSTCRHSRSHLLGSVT